MKDNILDELKQYSPPTRPLPIVEKAALLYETGGFKFSDAAKEAIRADLNQHGADLKALTDNIVVLGAFALYLRDSRNDTESMEALARIIGEHAPRYALIGDRVLGAFQEMAVKASDVFSSFSGAVEEKKRAPKFGEKGAPGTTPLKALKPVNAPPPRPKRPPQKKK